MNVPILVGRDQGEQETSLPPGSEEAIGSALSWCTALMDGEMAIAFGMPWDVPDPVETTFNGRGDCSHLVS